MVTISRLPGGGRYACVGGIGLARLDHRGPVHEVGVLAPGPVHGAGLGPSSAVAVAVARQLLLEPQVVAQHLDVVGGDDLGEGWHGPVGELNSVTVENSPERVADREALVQQGEEDLPQFGGHGGAVGRVEPDFLYIYISMIHASMQ